MFALYPSTYLSTTSRSLKGIIRATLSGSPQGVSSLLKGTALVAGLSVLSGASHAACTYTVDNEWGNGFVATITVKNDTTSAVNGWSVNWQYPSNRIASSWNATITGSSPYTATNLSWNGNLAPGQSASFGVQGTKGNSAAERPTINGTLCGGSTPPVSSAPASVAPPASSAPVVVSSSSRPASVASSSVASVPANNFAQNGGVESGLTNWSNIGGTLTRNTAVKRSGDASALISGRTAAWNGITFTPGNLANGNEYVVNVWVRLAAGTPDSVITLTAKRQDDSDASTYNEYTRVGTVTASANEWRLIEGYYTQSGSTAFQHFIIETTEATISYYADDFSVSGQPGAPVTSTSSSASSRPAATTKKFIGNITTSGAVRSDFTRYWNQITPENEGKWGSVEGTRDVYNWAPLDRIYAYARQNGIPVKAHTFVWGAQSPSWINNLSATETAAEIEEWIRDYCARYPDTQMIDVVNEAVPGHQPAGYAQKAFGNNWIQRVFQLARQYCPNSILILNDYNNIRWQHNEFITLAKAQGNYIDAVGLQAHELKGLTAAQVKTAIDNIWNQVGKPIYISEYDIGDNNDQVQLQNFQAHFPVFWDHPHVHGITIWGYVNGRTWIEGSGLMSDSGAPRPAMTWLLNNYINK